MEQFLSWLPDTPIVPFTLLLLVILTIPPIFERLRLPGLVGLLIAGVCLGPDGLGLLNPESEMMKLLSDIGKVYLMFVAGLEIDLQDFRRQKNRSLAFGIATFAFPLLVGTAIGWGFGLGGNAAVLLGSLMASHTLLGYPIVSRLGVAGNEAVTVTIGATIFTDIAALLVLAICVSIHAGNFSITSLIIQLGALALYSTVILFGLSWIGKDYFRRSGDEESNQFLFILLSVFLASVGSQLINVDKIVGAFLAGLAVNDVIKRGPVEEKVVFVGSTLFIPFFFVGMGLLLDLSAFISTLRSDLGLTLAIVAGLVGSKLIAASVIKPFFQYKWAETLTMWSLSLPQVAATLAAALVGVSVGLISESIFNAIVVLMLVTSVLGPVLTTKFASELPRVEPSQPIDWSLDLSEDEATDLALSRPFTVVVPIYNPLTTRHLIEMGALLAQSEGGVLIPLTIAKAHVHMDEPQLNDALKRSKHLIEKAALHSQNFQIQTQPIIRIDDDVAHGISRTAREQDSHLVILGWSPTTGLRARLFGTVINSVFWSSHCPVAVVRLVDDPINIHRILVPVKNITPRAIRPVQFAQLFAQANQAQITLLHVSDPLTPPTSVKTFEDELAQITQTQLQQTITTVTHDDPAQEILKLARDYDLVVLRSVRRRTAGGLRVSDVTTRLVADLTCSVVLFGEPYGPY